MANKQIIFKRFIEMVPELECVVEHRRYGCEIQTEGRVEVVNLNFQEVTITPYCGVNGGESWTRCVEG